MKYIDADKLIAEIERLKAEQVQYSDIYGSVDDYARASMCEGMVSTLSHLLSFIESLPEEKPFPNWRDIDKEKPEQGQDCACVSVTYDGDIKYNNFADGPWYWDAKGHYISDDDEPGVFVGHNDWGDRETHTCSYWMPWEELFDVLEKPLKEKANDREDFSRDRKRMNENCELGNKVECFSHRAVEDNDILALIESLQQEQPMPDSTQLIEWWHEDKEMLKEKDFRDDPWRLAYNAFMCGFGRGIAVKKQEQPEVDLEKETKLWWKEHLYLNPENKLWMDAHQSVVFARHFYELGLNARKEDIVI